MPYAFPANDLDRPDVLLESLGSFWSGTYGGRDLVRSYVDGRAHLEQQTEQDFRELLAAVSRYTVPVYHTELVYALVIRESDLNSSSLARFDGQFVFDNGLAYDQAGSPLFIWGCPDNLVLAPMITASLTTPATTLITGLDYYVIDGRLVFAANPFELPDAAIQPVFEGDVVVDRILTLWLLQSQWDRFDIASQFGYVLGLNRQSSTCYRNAVNAVYDAWVLGPNDLAVRRLFAAVADAPLVEGDETVEAVVTDANYVWVITDANAYRYGLGAAATVVAGDRVVEGDTLTNTLAFYEFNRGQIPPADEIAALTIGRGFLSAEYAGDLTFRNETLPWDVVPDYVDPSGYTRMSFSLGGFDGDVEQFWDTVHERGIAAEQTIAMQLDRRDSPVGQPIAASLPTTVNPLAFLAENTLRSNVLVVKLRTAGFGPDATGFAAARMLRRILNSHTACIVLTELTATPDRGTVSEGDESGRASRFVYAAETTDLSDNPDDRVRVRRIGSVCQT